MIDKLLNSFLQYHGISFEKQVDLKKKTWIHRGGIATYYIMPDTIDKLKEVCSLLYKYQKNFELVGCTSNLYFKNSYHPDIVISTLKIVNIQETDDSLICDCGVNVARLARKMVKMGVQGFEGLIDLPGTVGGAVCNFSSCYGCSIVQMLEKIEFLQSNGEVIFLYPSELGFTCRSSSIKRKELQGVILRVFINKVLGDTASLIKIAEKNHNLRKKSQEGPAYNLGSCFNSFKTNGILCLIIRVISFLWKWFARFCKLNDEKYLLIKQKIHYSFLGYSCLISYVSSKSPNCFIWKDEGADEIFHLYKKYMKLIYKAENLEIEIKDVEKS